MIDQQLIKEFAIGTIAAVMVAVVVVVVYNMWTVG